MSQVTRKEPVFFLSAFRIEFNAISADTIKSMAYNQVVTTTDLVLEAACDSELDQNCLRQLVLNLDHRLHEMMAIWVQLRVDLEDGLFNSFRIKDDRTVAACDDFFLLSDSFDKRVD